MIKGTLSSFLFVGVTVNYYYHLVFKENSQNPNPMKRTSVCVQHRGKCISSSNRKKITHLNVKD